MGFAQSRWKILTAVAVAVAAALACVALLVPSSRASGSSPTFVQQVSAHASGASSLSLTPTSAVTSGNRLVVLVGVWSSGNATAASVSDTAGNTYTEVLHFIGSDGTEMSVWTAPITVGGATRPAITVKSSAKADVGAAVSEYSGLSAAAGAAAVDQTAHATGTTSAAATVASGATAGSGQAGELAIGFYLDSGFGGSPKAGSGWSQRATISGASDMDLLTEDQALAGAGTTANATASTSAKTVWLMATVVLSGTLTSPASPPAAPTGVTATAGDGSAAVSWTAPSNGGAPITSYTVTPYSGQSPLTPTTVTGPDPATRATITGLTDGTTYTFTVSATNSAGAGPASSASNAVTPAASSGGSWGPLMSWPMVAIHSMLMYTGQVLQFDGWQYPEPTQVWNPASQTFTTQTAPDSAFCSGMAQMPDGRILVVGGWGGLTTGNLGITDTAIFDPATQTWSEVAPMHYPRWYPDLTELANGQYVAISGNSTDADHWADTPEVYDPTTNTWTVLTGINTSGAHEEEYPFSYLEPNGDVFTIAPAEDASYQLDVNAKTWTQIGGPSGVVNGSSVMYRPGQILYSGGAANLNSSTPSAATAAVINLNDPTPQWRQIQPMAHARIYHTLTMLADGSVLAVGGEPTAGQTGPSEVSGGILPSEIWNPSTQTWSPAAATAVTRGYHSTAVLMPDGTVLVAGSGHANPGLAGQNSAQIYSPPYLSKGQRPTITQAPATTAYGSSINIQTPDASSIGAVNLVSLGTDTHQSDMSQHFVPLSFTSASGSLTVQTPAQAALAPPGFYMLFIVNSAGVPSVASIIQIGPNLQAPAAPTAVTASPLDGGAQVHWTAPASNGGSPIRGYTVTPHTGGTALPATTVSGVGTTSATVSGLTDGTTYTFTVTATNAVGVGAASTPSAPVTPTANTGPVAVQSGSAHAGGVSTLSVTLANSPAAGDRLVVETGAWSSGGATVKSVTDSAGDTFTELMHQQAKDNTEMTVWSAPVSAAGGKSPTITATTTGTSDLGLAVVDYAGLSSIAGSGIVDQSAQAVGQTSGAATVSSGATPATTGSGELAVGVYADSGFGDSLKAGTGFTTQVNTGADGDMELLEEDQVVGSGAKPAATVSAGANTVWQMATLVLKGSGSSGSSAMLVAKEMQQARTSPLQTVADSPWLMARHWSRAIDSRRTRRAYACSSRGPRRSRFCRSVRQTAAIAKTAHRRFLALARRRHLSPALLMHSGHAMARKSMASRR